MYEAENLTRWRDSGDPHRFVWGCTGAWSEQEFASFLASLRSGQYWPLNEDDVRKTLDDAADTYHDLKRWNLLADQAQERTDVPKQSEDDGIFF